jgi:hypothetical protein
MDLNEETAALTKLLSGKIVRHVVRHRIGEVLVQFSDGTRLYVDARSDEVECSVTEGYSGEGSSN